MTTENLNDQDLSIIYAALGKYKEYISSKSEENSESGFAEKASEEIEKIDSVMTKMQSNN